MLAFSALLQGNSIHLAAIGYECLVNVHPCTSLCCVGSYFTAVDLADIGRELDVKESIVHGRQVSGNNYDDSGYFSIQVSA